MLFSFLTFSQDLSEVSGKMQSFRDSLESLFPIIAGIVFIVGVLINLPKLKGEDRDVKKFIINVLIYPAALFLVAGIYKMVTSFAL